MARAGGPAYEPLIATYLIYPEDPEVSALAVQVLTAHWRVGMKYREQILELLGSPEWDSGDDAFMAAVAGAGAILRDGFDAELLRALLKLAEEGRGEYNDDLMQGFAVEAIARALGASHAELTRLPEGVTNPCSSPRIERTVRSRPVLMSGSGVVRPRLSAAGGWPDMAWTLSMRCPETDGSSSTAATGSPQGDHMRHYFAAALGTVALTTSMLVSAPLASASTSAYPVKSFEVVVGNTYTKGTITWYNRAVRVAGEHKSVESCRGTTAYTLDSAGNQLGKSVSETTVCGSESQKFSFDVPADVVGGAAVVRVCLDDGATSNPTALECVLKNR